MPLARMAREISLAASRIGPTASGGRSSTYAACAFGMTSTWPGFIGRTSMNASVHESSRTRLAGTSRRTTLQKMQSRAEAAMGRDLSLLRRGPQEMLRDDQLLNLVRALVEPEDPCIAEVSLHVELAAESVSAVHLDGPVRDPLGHLGSVELGHRDLDRVVLTEIPQVRRTKSEEARGVNLDRRLRDHLPDQLEVSDRPSERFAVFHVLRRGLEGGSGHADGSGGDADPAAVQGPHGLVPAVPFLADEVLLRDAAVLERKVRGRTRPQSELRRRLDVGDLETRGVLRHQEERDAFVALRPRLPRVHLDVVRDAPVRDEPFLAIQHPFVSIEPGGRRQVPRVAPRLGFRDRPRPETLPFREGHEPGLLLRLRAEPHEGGLAQRRLDRDRRAHGRRAAADLLDE